MCNDKAEMDRRVLNLRKQIKLHNQFMEMDEVFIKPILNLHQGPKTIEMPTQTTGADNAYRKANDGIVYNIVNHENIKENLLRNESEEYKDFVQDHQSMDLNTFYKSKKTVDKLFKYNRVTHDNKNTSARRYTHASHSGGLPRKEMTHLLLFNSGIISSQPDFLG
jgi:hypothetical protein